MIWHIAKRELYDNLNSLRFALTTVLLLGLMLTNADCASPRASSENTEVSFLCCRYARNVLDARTDSLYDLARKGPGKLYKKPSPLHFCAEGGHTFLSGAVEANYHFWDSNEF